MTDHHAGYLITLTSNVREDDAETILSALRLIRGVADVQPVISNLDQQIGQVRADGEWRERLYRFLSEKP